MAKSRESNKGWYYRRPLPIVLSTEEYGPLPTLFPHNPLSWIIFAYRYLLIKSKSVPQATERPYKVEYKDDTFRVHDVVAMQSLWRQGFFGKGSLSRSHPTWRDRIRDENILSMEEITSIRRAERNEFKQVRSRLQELELLDKKNKIETTEQKQELLLLKDTTSITREKDDATKLHKILEAECDTLEDLEYLQLQATEVFFLRFALNVIDIELSLSQLFEICCNGDIRPDNPFILEYVAYHHYRSLGWCVRSGIKFGTNFLLYQRGPPFNHAEHAILIVTPCYQWHQISAISRVIGGVKKNLVLLYIDIPPISTFKSLLDEKSHDKHFYMRLFKLYKINEIIYRRWVPGRNRD